MKRQFITDEKGEKVGVILPIEEYSQVESLLRKRSTQGDEKKLRQLEQAIRDPLFMTDLKETMSDFAVADRDWWEPGA
ncbi:MAG: hypothetical protein V3T83_10795 [Acidobacteriota bacterium]